METPLFSGFHFLKNTMLNFGVSVLNFGVWHHNYLNFGVWHHNYKFLRSNL